MFSLVAASSSLDSHIRFWDLQTGQALKSIDAGPGKHLFSLFTFCKINIHQSLDIDNGLITTFMSDHPIWQSKSDRIPKSDFRGSGNLISCTEEVLYKENTKIFLSVVYNRNNIHF